MDTSLLHGRVVSGKSENRRSEDSLRSFRGYSAARQLVIFP